MVTTASALPAWLQVRDPDPNLKYLGLTGLSSLMRSNPRVVAEHREVRKRSLYACAGGRTIGSQR